MARQGERRSGPSVPPDDGSPVYLAGLILAGRRVVVVGGGRVAARRVPKLLAAGALVHVIAPELHPALARHAAEGRLQWHPRTFDPGDLQDAWYALALTDSAAVNAAVVAEAHAQRTFCVRADEAESGSAWTPATGSARRATVAAITDQDPLRARRMRDRLVQVVESESL